MCSSVATATATATAAAAATAASGMQCEADRPSRRFGYSATNARMCRQMKKKESLQSGTEFSSCSFLMIHGIEGDIHVDKKFGDDDIGCLFYCIEKV